MKTKTLLKKTVCSVIIFALLNFFINPSPGYAAPQKLNKNEKKGWYWFRGKSYSEMLGELKGAEIIAEELSNLIRSGKKPNIMASLVSLERARLSGTDIASPEGNTLYTGEDFTIKEKTETKGTLEIRTVSVISQSGETISEERMAANEIIVGLDSYEDAQALTENGALTIAEAPPAGQGAYKMKIEDEKRVEEALAAVTTHGNTIIQENSFATTTGNISFAEPNGIIGVSTNISRIPSDPEFWSQWGLHNVGQDLPLSDERFDVPKGTPDVDIDAPEAWDITKGNKNIPIAIIDTGCDYNHPDLYPNIWKNLGEVAGNGYDDDGNGFIDDVYGWNFSDDTNDPMDDHNHGTHVAGIVAASGENGKGISGVMQSASLMIIKVLDDEVNGTWYNAAQGINYAVENGAKVINISWSGTD
ncbi:MAG: S8 family serine peptidase, partial [Omnitrophica bacterium]|nr:S8 family serine peptidase [Candidatus Omnitrophota bacterium]